LFFTLKDKISLISMPKKVMWCDCHTCTVMWENSYPTDYCTAYFKISKRHEGDRHLKFDCQNMPWIYHDSYSHWFTFVSMIFSLIYICISDILIDLHLYQWVNTVNYEHKKILLQHLWTGTHISTMLLFNHDVVNPFQLNLIICHWQ
jgi:hypothetical protein